MCIRWENIQILSFQSMQRLFMFPQKLSQLSEICLPLPTAHSQFISSCINSRKFFLVDIFLFQFLLLQSQFLFSQFCQFIMQHFQLPFSEKRCTGFTTSEGSGLALAVALQSAFAVTFCSAFVDTAGVQSERRGIESACLCAVIFNKKTLSDIVRNGSFASGSSGRGDLLIRLSIFFIDIEQLLVLVFFLSGEPLFDQLFQFLSARLRMGLNENDSSDGCFGIERALPATVHNLLLTIFNQSIL